MVPTSIPVLWGRAHRMKRKFASDTAEEEGHDESEEEEEYEEEEELQALILEETLPAFGEYSFHVKLSAHYEYETVVDVHVTILCGESKIGFMEALVIDRDFQPSWNFHELCDALSGELQRLTFGRCHDDGRLRYAEFHGLTAEKDSAASAGGFLHIDLVSIDPEHRRKDVGVRCVKTVLEWMNLCDEEAHKAWGERLRSIPFNFTSRLRFGWSFAVMSPNSESDFGAHKRAQHAGQAEERPEQQEAAAASREEQEHGADAEAEAVVPARRKIARNWARLGFRQASFGSEFWYLTPSRLCLKSKPAVANVTVTEMPKCPAVADEDEPLLEYLLECKASGPPSTFEVDVREYVRQGADLDRMNALHRALKFGITSHAHYRLLVDLGADPQGVNALGRSALHGAAHFTGHGHERLSRGIEAVHALLNSIGASRSATDIFGKNPLDVLLAKRHFQEAIDGFIGHGLPIDRRRVDDECLEDHLECELMRLLLEPAQRAALTHDVLTPRQNRRLQFYAEMRLDDCQLSLPRFEARVPVPADSFNGSDVPYWDHIPEHVRGTEVYKSFVYGHAEIVVAMCRVILHDHDSDAAGLPTPAAILNELQTGRYDHRYLNFFFRQGGEVHFAIEGMLEETRHSDLFFYNLSDHDHDLREEYEAILEHPFDEEWGLVRTMVLGTCR